jgi:hypothetical protein
VPLALSVPGAPPLANFLAHALIRVDTSSRQLAVALRRAELPAWVARAARYQHSRPAAVPSGGALDIHPSPEKHGHDHDDHSDVTSNTALAVTGPLAAGHASNDRRAARHGEPFRCRQPKPPLGTRLGALQPEGRGQSQSTSKQA